MNAPISPAPVAAPQATAFTDPAPTLSACRITVYAAIAGLFVWLPPMALAIREWDTLASRLLLGADYISFYAASLMALDGAPALV